ncbi:hypothetical protein BHE74_00037919 [Ensete ventricosum]|nr:hypothetical protein BHE74_00037919 [Ensete ventricosum]
MCDNCSKAGCGWSERQQRRKQGREMWRSYARVTVGGYGKRLEMVAPGRGRRGVKDADAIAEDSAVVGKAIEVMAVGNKGAVSNGMKGNSCCCYMRCWEEMPTTSALAEVGLGGRWRQRRGSDIIFGGGIGDGSVKGGGR